MSKRLWFVLVGGQAGAVVGPVLSRYQSGDCLQFIYSRQTADQQRRLEACFDEQFGAFPTAKHLAEGREPLNARALLQGALAAFGGAAAQNCRVVVVGNGGPKQWFFSLLEALRSSELDYELLLSQGSILTAAAQEAHGAWRFESSPIASLSLHELCRLVAVDWDGSRLSVPGGTLELARLESHYNRLHAHVHVQQNNPEGIPGWCRSRLLPPHLHKFSLEPRHVAVTGIEATSGIYPRLNASRFRLFANDSEVSAHFRQVAESTVEAPESSHVGPIPFAPPTGLQSGPVGILIVGTLAGNTFATIEQLSSAGCRSVLIVADGASARTVENVRQITEQLEHSPRYQHLSWDVLWAKRGTRSGMALWREAPDVPEIEPGPLGAELRRRLASVAGGRVSVIANMQPGDRAFGWALWEALNGLRDDHAVSWTLESRPSDSPLLLRLKLQAGVEDVTSSPIVGHHNLTRAPITSADVEELHRLSQRFARGSREFSPKALAEYGPDGNKPDWFRLEKAPTDHGPVFERLVALRLAQVLEGDAAAFLNVQCFGSKPARRSGPPQGQLPLEDEMDLVTLVEPRAFVVWEAKGRAFKSLNKKREELKLAVSRTFKYSPLLPEKTHTVAVVPDNDSQLEWRYKHDVCVIDLRILLDDRKLKALATRGPGEVAPPHVAGVTHA